MSYAIIGSGKVGQALARAFARKGIEVSIASRRPAESLAPVAKAIRAATPDEVAGVIAFLASEDALFINGVNLPIDGGLHASNGQPNFLSLFGQG